MTQYDPRSLSTPVYTALSQLKTDTPELAAQKEQKNQAVELYTYLSTWGLLRLKAEETALQSQAQKQKVVKKFFHVLAKVMEKSENEFTINYLTGLPASDYLGVTGIALQLAREFSFWAESIYPKD